MTTTGSTPNPSPTNLEKDPVCGMMIGAATAKGGSSHFGDKIFYFCNPKCREKFMADPLKYVDTVAVQTPLVAQAGATFTCPMHPEIVRDHAGSCPICGMALESVSIEPEPTANPELRDMTIRFWVSAALSIPLLVLAMSMMSAQAQVWGHKPWVGWLELAFATPVVMWGGRPFLMRGIQSIFTRQLNMFTLIAIGTGAAFGFSVVALVAPQLFSGAHHPPLYFESAAVITTLALLGQVLELRARSATQGAMRALLKLSPKEARRIEANGSEQDVPVETICVGDHLRVRPGEKVPVDGVVLDGASAVDESLVTGESLPITKTSGDELIGGTMNGAGAIIMRAEHVGSDTVLARIVKLVAEAQRSRAPIQRLADAVSGYFVPAVIAAAVLTAIVWGIFGPEPKVVHALVNAVAVLIIACPCALGLATPMSIMVSSGRGAQAGVLIRNAEALERLAKIDVIVIDKTGTLTEGKPVLQTVRTFAGATETEVLSLAASLEACSEHPLAGAILSGAKSRGIAFAPATEFRAVAGKGVVGSVGGHRTALGNQALMQALSVEGSELVEVAPLQADGQTVMYVARGKTIIGLVAVIDPMKASTPDAILALKKSGLRIVVATGDSRSTADAIAQKLGIDAPLAGVLPEEKKDIVAKLQREGHIVAMVGDGVNDAPALAQADVGIAMGTGTDVAIQSAALTLVNGDLRGVVRALALSRATLRNIKQNLFFAFAYNLVGVPLAAGVLYPTFGILLSPMIASAAMSLSSVCVIGNALRLRRVRL